MHRRGTCRKEGISEQGEKTVSIAEICHLYHFALYMLSLLYIDFIYKLSIISTGDIWSLSFQQTCVTHVGSDNTQEQV